MTKSEVQKVITLLLACDGGCIVCCTKLIRAFKRLFPQHAELAEEMFRKDFGCGTDEADE
jgi:hypothetical protein